MARCKKKAHEGKKRKQAKACGLLANTEHRSTVSAGRWLRPWIDRMHQYEMAELKKRFESNIKMGD